MRHATAAQATLLAYPIRLEDPFTHQFPDGTFHSPGEGVVMRIGVNDTDELDGRTPLGTWNGMTVLRAGYMFGVLYNTDWRTVLREVNEIR